MYGQPSFEAMELQARNYWAEAATDDPVWEIVSETSVQIVERIREAQTEG